MKEATGELSTTVITVVAIAAISSLFIVFLYPQLKASIILNQACSNGPGYTYGLGANGQATNSGYSVNCTGGASGGQASADAWTCVYTEGTRTESKQCNQSR